MRLVINNSNLSPHNKRIEIVECKGVGHPDSLANTIAESACSAICRYFKRKYKKIPRFNIDQVEINGGEIDVNFKKNQFIKPGFITISGKSSYYSPQDIVLINKITINETKKVLSNIFNRKILKYFIIKSEINRYSQNNKIFFENNKQPLSEDTSLGIGFFPYTDIEKLALIINSKLLKFSRNFPIGKDTKVMILRNNHKIQIIISVAFLSNQIKNIKEYFVVKEKLKISLEKFLKEKNLRHFQLVINAADDQKTGKVYITSTGTAAEHDKGSLGRGNGISEMITPARSASLEVVWGKNPVFNVSKIYNLLAHYLARRIAKLIKNNYIEVEILSKIGNQINTPQLIIINTSSKTSKKDNTKIKNTLKKEFNALFAMSPGLNYTILTDKILKKNLL